MKHSLRAILVLCPLLTACNRHDAALRHAITGDWAHGSHEIELARNGTFHESFHPPNGTLIYAGTWQIKDGILSFTVTNVSGPEPYEPVGSVDHGRIVSLDAHQLIYKSQGQIINLTR